MPNQEVHPPLEPCDCPGIDDFPLLNMEDIKKYWQMIGEIQWVVALGHIGIIAATMTMTRFRLAHCQGQLKHLKHIYCFLCNYKKTDIKFNTEIPYYSNYEVEKKNWGHIYHLCQEEIPGDMTEPRGKPMMTTTFADANSLHDVITGRSCTGIIHLLNNTPIDWFSKRQNAVETAAYGSEFVAPRTA
eukprot:14348049-Ditylum_brightwellii.AAC.1